MKLLSEFGLEKINVTFMQNKGKKEIVLCARDSLGKFDEIAFKVFAFFFKKFIVLHHDEFYEDVISKVKKAGLSNTGDISDIAKKAIMQHFEKYIQNNEIDIICEIEREKSPFYVNKYTDLKIQKIA